jgi:SSS family solute:Na+ symporter
VVLYPTFQIFLIPLFLIGYCGVLFDPPPAQPDQVLPHMLMHMEIPALLVGLFCAGALAASMSSGDAMAHAAASILVRDGLARAAGLKMDAAGQRTAMRWSLVLLIVASYIVAVLYKGSLVYLLLTAYGGVVQFAPAVVATLVLRRVNGPAVLAGLVVGALVTVLLIVWPDLRPWEVHAGMYGLAANVLVMSVISWLAKGDRTSLDEEFLRTAGQPESR